MLRNGGSAVKPAIVWSISQSESAEDEGEISGNVRSMEGIWKVKPMMLIHQEFC